MTKHCAACLNMIFQSTFVSFTINYWSNTKKSIKVFYETVFPYFEKIKEEKRFPTGKHSIVIMDTFKGENNDMLKKIVLK